MPDPHPATGLRSVSQDPPRDTGQAWSQARPSTNGHSHPSILRAESFGETRRADGGAARHIDRGESTDQAWRDYLDRLDAEDLRQLAATLPVIEQAKGILMGRYGCDAVAAFTVLRRWSSTRNVKLRIIAAEVVAAASRPDATPPDDTWPDAPPSRSGR